MTPYAVRADKLCCGLCGYARNSAGRLNLSHLRKGDHLEFVSFAEGVGPDEPDCVTWRGPTDDRGYAVTRCLSNFLYAHILSYECYITKVGFGVTLSRRCGNGLCVNPLHSDVVHLTPQDCPLCGRVKPKLYRLPLFVQYRNTFGKGVNVASECAKIRAEWDDETEEVRRAGPSGVVEWNVPEHHVGSRRLKHPLSTYLSEHGEIHDVTDQ